MTKDDIAATFEEIATLLEIQGENVFRCNAYRNAARAVSQIDGDLKTLVASGELDEIRGIGKTIAEKIATMVETGELPYLTELQAKVPEGLRKLLKLPGVGPKKVKAMHDALGIDSIESLRKACETDQVAKLKGFGAKTQAKILEGIAFIDTVGNRVRIDLAMPLGYTLLQQLKELPGVLKGEVCGSIRRRRETTKDIDILIAADDAGPIMDAFVKLPEVMQIVGHGETKSSIVAGMHLDGHIEKIVLNADLRVVTEAQFPFALAYFTGSKAHNIRMRQRAIERKLSLNEYALAGKDEEIACSNEKEIYAALDLQYVEPELREDTGEIEAAEKHRLPKLVTTKNLRGVFHNHTTYSDGIASLEEMAAATKALGMEYFGVADHSQYLKMANGMTPARARQQMKEIDALNKTLKGVRIIKGVECDILEDGTLDFDDDLLAMFDYVVASVHTHFGMASDAMTARICKALSHPSVTMLGHATGRLVAKREAYKVDLDKVIECAAKHGKMIEINASPMRLDLDWMHAKKAKKLGIPLVINPDAHSPAELANVQFGIFEARRGWLEAKDVFNCLGVDEVMAELERRKVG